MRIIDARSGRDVTVGEWVFYPPPSPIALTFDGPPNAPDSMFDLVPQTKPDGTTVLTPVPRDPTRWRLIDSSDKPILVPGHGPVSKDSFRVLELHDRGDHADVRIQTITGRSAWAKAPVRGALFWRTVVLPT